MTIRAINCTQCGATVQDISIHSTLAECEYCGARILLEKSRPVTKEVHYVTPPSFSTDEPKTWPVGAIVIAVAIAVALSIIIWLLIASSGRDQTEPLHAFSQPPAPVVAPEWTDTPAISQKPAPVVNYQPRLSWDGPNDIEYFDDPVVDISSVSHLTTEEIKASVFKNRIVKLRVVIDTQGEIESVETISGHPILVEAATASAKRSVFRSRSKPTTRVLTYTFRVLKD